MRRAGWTALLREAHLGWLPKGKSGRPPSKADLDENVKAERECRAILTQMKKALYYGDDPIELRDALRSAWGGKTEYLRSERDRLSSPPENELDVEVP